MLQELCAPRLLVDTTPVYALSPMILQRAREVFESARYLHLVCHPYAAIESAVLRQLDFTWDHAEQAWFDTNLNVHTFLLDIEPEAKLTLRCALKVHWPIERKC